MMSLGSNTGMEPIFEKRSVTICNRSMSFSISSVPAKGSSCIFNSSTQPMSDEMGVPS